MKIPIEAYENIKLLKLQKAYEDGKIKEEDLTLVQVEGIKKLYKKQIIFLKKRLNKK